MAWQNPTTWTPGSTPGATEFNLHIRDMFNAVLPVGTLIHRVAAATAGIETVVENRFLECNGVAVSRTTYATLFNYLNSLGLPFGVGNGTSTFNIPDLRGRVPVSAAGTGGHADVISLGGTEGAALNIRRPKHYHQFVGRDGAIGLGPYSQGNNIPTTYNTTLAGTSPLDAPAYQVTGVWFIKYTA